ncbi:MAG: methyltransferase domain-containing protein [Alphaproteobacteria bacterium]|nr:methyltransferase domain-containing protein [Alphaproteobacteria bacterium]
MTGVETVPAKSYDRARLLRNLRVNLMLKRSWRYLRYLHAREALLALDDCRSVLVVGAGTGLAEVTLAVEFPEVEFHVTDYEGATHSIAKAKEIKETFQLANVSFDLLNIITAPTPKRRFDLVYSVEVLEHIEDDALAAGRMLEHADKYVFCLVPFADAASNQDEKKRAHAWQVHEHFRVGYDVVGLASAFPYPAIIRGCYWKDAGIPFRKKLEQSSDDAIRAGFDALAAEADADCRDRMPATPDDALGIWCLSRINR